MPWCRAGQVTRRWLKIKLYLETKTRNHSHSHSHLFTRSFWKFRNYFLWSRIHWHSPWNQVSYPDPPPPHLEWDSGISDDSPQTFLISHFFMTQTQLKLEKWNCPAWHGSWIKTQTFLQWLRVVTWNPWNLIWTWLDVSLDSPLTKLQPLQKVLLGSSGFDAIWSQIPGVSGKGNLFKNCQPPETEASWTWIFFKTQDY